jgi:hypothetical protein
VPCTLRAVTRLTNARRIANRQIAQSDDAAEATPLHLTPRGDRENRCPLFSITAVTSTPPTTAIRNPTLADMTDSPIAQAPLDPNEQPILDRLLAVRDELYLLKQDKSTYVKSHDVISLHDQVLEQVHKLNEIRTDKRSEQNRGSWNSGSGCRPCHMLLLVLGMYIHATPICSNWL